MSHPPDYPGRQRFRRAATRAGNEAYQGAVEAVGAVLMAGGIGYWIDSRWETSPYGLVIGAIIGFAAMVLRLLRLGQQMYPEGEETAATGHTEAVLDRSNDDEIGGGIGVAPGMSEVLREDGEADKAENAQKERLENERSARSIDERLSREE